MDGFERLTPKQQKALQSLLLHPSIRDAAKECGSSETTLWRWLQEPDFSEAYRAARARLLESTLVSLQSASVEAVTTLKEIMADKTSPPAARVSAAKSVLDTALKAREVLEVAERLAYLEKFLEVKKEKQIA